MPAMLASPYVLPILMLIGSNVFMTTAWYWHLRYKEVPLISVIFLKAYPVDSGRATCCVLSNRIRAVIGTNINGQRAFAFPIPEGIF
jgi:uncharacterized protein (DUF486 family)